MLSERMGNGTALLRHVMSSCEDRILVEDGWGLGQLVRCRGEQRVGGRGRLEGEASARERTR